MSKLQTKLIDQFADAEYAQAYMDAHVNTKIAAQIYWTRRERGWTQQELAEKAGMAQERVSKIESGDFSSLNMTTLRKFAQALDVCVRVEFQPFSNGIYDVCRMHPSAMAVQARPESLAEMKTFTAAVTTLYSDVPIGIPTGGSQQIVITSSVKTAGPNRIRSTLTSVEDAAFEAAT